MLVDRSQILITKIEALEGKQVEAGDAKNYATRSDALHDPVKVLKRLVQTIDMLKTRGVKVPNNPPDGGLRSRLETLSSNYDNDSDSILVPDGDMQWGFWQRLDELPRQLEVKIKFAWSKHVDETVFPIPPKIVSALANGSSEWRKLSTLYERIETIKNQLPDAETVTQFESLVKDERAAKKNLGGDSDLEDLEPFILKAQAGNADLSMITDELKSRLDEMGILGLFSIGIVGAGS